MSPQQSPTRRKFAAAQWPPVPEYPLSLPDGRTLRCADPGGPGRPLLALHGTFGRGANFARVAGLLATRGIRLIAPDQRGHGHSDRPVSGDFGADAFVTDAAAALQQLGLGPLPVLGHSRGGITAYQLAARHPELVSALLVEDVGPVVRHPELEHPVLDVRGWPRTAATREALGAAIEARGVPDAGYFLQSAEPHRGGWRLLFDWDDMMAVQHGGCGDWWADWLGSRCPALVLHAGHGTLLPADMAGAMAERRPHATLMEFPHAGHWIHDDDPDGFAAAVAEFVSGPDVAG